MPTATPSPSISGTVQARPNRRANDRLRAGRKHLTEAEIERLIKAAKKHGRYGHRNATAIKVCFQHGLRAGELCNLEWSQIDFNRGTLHVNRLKTGTPSTHYLSGSELRALRALRRETSGRFVFSTERNEAASTAWFRKMFARVGVEAGMPFPVNPHMLRHACGFKFANAGKDTRSLQGYLGHRNIQSTTIYTDLAPDRFKGWEEE